jgi:oligopeptide/dipeptide ABC transporter ATP-binding protein
LAATVALPVISASASSRSCDLRPSMAIAEHADAALLQVSGLRKSFTVGGGLLPGRRAQLRAVDDVSFELRAGETLAVVGESGCGKSTMARTVTRILRPDAGQIRFAGQDISALDDNALRPVRRRMQYVFQDAYGSLNPRMCVEDLIAEPLRIHGLWRRAESSGEIGALLERVGLAPALAKRHPHELSGGQRQRVGLARALALRPDVLVLDEPVSALDVSVQAQVVNLLADLQAELGLAYILIAHDLALVRMVADRVAVMYLGQIVEIGPRDDLYERPAHPYTSALLGAVPISSPKLRSRRPPRVAGDPPSPLAPPSGCSFRTRCPRAQERCAHDAPALEPRQPGDPGGVACHYPLVPIAGGRE